MGDLPTGDRARTAFVLTISDGVSAGTRQDGSGDALAALLSTLGFMIERGVVPDDRARVADATRDAAARHPLVVTTGGTGLGPRDTTPQAMTDVLAYEIPGFGEQMRAHGRTFTPMADLSRSLAGVIDRTLVICVPGSPNAARESIEAIQGLIDHALETIGGRTEHEPGGTEDAVTPASEGARGDHQH